MLKKLIERLTGQISDEKEDQVGLALGGGGARGFVHLGVVKGLAEKGIKPAVISGTSAGSIVGAFLAAGREPDDILRILKEKNIFGYSKISWPKEGLFKLDGLAKMLEAEIEADQLEDLPIPLIVTASNLNTGKVRYFEEGKLSDIVTASASIPFIFTPVTIDGEKYVDGGVLDNLPAKPLLSKVNEVIAINISPIEHTEELDSLVKVAARTFQMSVNTQALATKKDCTLFIEPKGVRGYDIFDLEKADELFEIGYEYIADLDVEALQT